MSGENHWVSVSSGVWKLAINTKYGGMQVLEAIEFASGRVEWFIATEYPRRAVERNLLRKMGRKLRRAGMR